MNISLFSSDDDYDSLVLDLEEKPIQNIKNASYKTLHTINNLSSQQINNYLSSPSFEILQNDSSLLEEIIKKQHFLEKIGLFDPQLYFLGPIIPDLAIKSIDKRLTDLFLIPEKIEEILSCPIQPKPKIRTTPIIKIGEYLQKKPNTSRIKTIMDKKITQKSLSQHIDNENIKFLKWNLSPKDVIKKPTSTGKKLNVFVNSINNNQDSKGSKVLKAILSPKFLPNKKTFQLEKTLKNKNDYSKCPIKQIIRKKAISISDNYNNNKENQPMRMISEKNYFENSFKHKFCKK